MIVPNISERVKTITAQYTAENLIGDREELAGKIEKLLSDRLVNNIKVVSTAIEDMDFTDEFTNAVEAKQFAVQNKLKEQTKDIFCYRSLRLLYKKIKGLLRNHS